MNTAPAGFVGCTPVPPVPPPREATSLEQLFSMALALADKPYQLISPSPDRQVPSQMAPWFRWRPALLVREVHPGRQSGKRRT